MRTLGQPFVIEGRHGIELTPTLLDGFFPECSKNFVPLDHDLRMKRNRFRLDGPKVLYRSVCVTVAYQPEAPQQRPGAIIA